MPVGIVRLAGRLLCAEQFPLIGAYVVSQHRSNILGAVQTMGWPGFWIALLSTLAMVCFISALKLAPVAEVMTVHAAIPFVTDVLAATFVGVRESWVTWGASIVALGRVAIMVNPNAPGIHIKGYSFAGVIALSYAAMMVIIRQQRHVSMLPAAALFAGLCALLVLPAVRPLGASLRPVAPCPIRHTPVRLGLATHDDRSTDDLSH
ncbi:hypothetical protein [Microvirga rosea]|uniref:hypothetical protein n=1 Tax=Microvirga rosea TaxID=2715425 RepID=UPI001D0B20DF|nr:hypothetical protein [Microvirga rosea]MCB8823147.1 hypothetical protein [Microvirga rosea]